MFEEVRGLEHFKKWIKEDRDAFPDMQVTIVDDFGEQNKVAIQWTLTGTHQKEFAGSLSDLVTGNFINL